MRKLIILFLCTCFLSACTGMEIGGKLWMSRVDEKQESQRTYNIPLKCYLWANCSNPVEPDLK